MTVLELFVYFAVAGGGAYLGSYLREKGRNLATKEDLAPLVRNTEQIKAEVSGGLWTQQQVWSFKKEVYADLLKQLAEMAGATRIVLLASQSDDPNLRALISQQDERVRSAGPRFQELMSLAQLILSAPAFEVLSRLRFDASANPSTTPPELQRAIDLIEQARDRLIAEAKQDLKLGQQPGDR